MKRKRKCSLQLTFTIPNIYTYNFPCDKTESEYCSWRPFRWCVCVCLHTNICMWCVCMGRCMVCMRTVCACTLCVCMRLCVQGGYGNYYWSLFIVLFSALESPHYNHTGWLGVKHNLLTYSPLLSRLTVLMLYVQLFFLFFLFFIVCLKKNSTEVAYWQCCLVVAWLVPCETAAVSAQVLCTPYTHATVYNVTLFKVTYVGCMCV